jgi:hypothetical protein
MAWGIWKIWEKSLELVREYFLVEARNGYILTQAFLNLTRLGEIGEDYHLGLIACQKYQSSLKK